MISYRKDFLNRWISMILNEKYQKALNDFVDRYDEDPNVEAIIVTGSVLHSKPDKNSDLDVYVVLKESKIRERGNTWVNGVEIEYFINPIKQIYQYFEDEEKNNKITTLHMFANNEIVYKNGEDIDKIVQYAKGKLANGAQQISSYEKEMAKYFIDDLRKDLDDAINNSDNFSSAIVNYRLIEENIKVFLKLNRAWQEKPKRLFRQLEQIDPVFANFVSLALKSLHYKKTLELCGYTESLIGGARPKEWKIVSECTY